MRTNSILLEPTNNGGGGQGAAGGEGSAGGAQTGAQSGQQQAGAKPPPTTAEKLFGGMVKPAAEGNSGDGKAGAAPGGEANGGAAGRQGAAAPPPTQQQGQAGQAGQQAQAGNVIQMSEEVLAGLTKRIAESVQPKEQPKQLTQEEFNKMFNVYSPSEEELMILFGDDKKAAVQMLGHMLASTSKQATTIASHLIAHELQSLRQQFQPALSMAEERQMEKMKTEFFEQNADLKGYEPLLVLIRDQFVAKGVSFPTKEAAFKAVADEARKQIEAIPGLKGGAATAGQAAGQQQAAQTGSRMPVLSGGKGQSGAGDTGASSGAGKMNTAQRIFGPK